MKLGRGQREIIQQIATYEGFGIYSYDSYDFTFYNIQLWAAAEHRRIRRSRQTDILYENLTPAKQNHYCHLRQNRTQQHRRCSRRGISASHWAGAFQQATAYITTYCLIPR